MTTVQIANEERDMTDRIDEEWINEQVNRRRRDGASVCVRVSIREPYVQLRLSTLECEGPEGGAGILTSAQAAIIDLWNRVGLSGDHITSGNVIAFLKQLRQ